MMMQKVSSSINGMQRNSTNSVNGAGGATNSSEGGMTQTLQYEDFLKLLVTQLKYQDPLSPMDNTAFVAQNAQFSTVEQLIAIKKSLTSQQNVMQTANATYATNMIGKLVAADISDFNEAGEYVEEYATGIVEEVTFVKDKGEIILKLDSGLSVYLSQIVSVRAPEPAEP